MTRFGFRALFPTNDTKMGRLFQLLGQAGVLHIEVTTRSGRKFRYEVSEYRFGPEANPAEARALAERIAADKYRDCGWDRSHPRVAAEAEIADALYDLIVRAVERMRSPKG